MVILGGRSGRSTSSAAVTTTLALSLESIKLGTQVWRKASAGGKVIKLHVTDRVIDASDAAWITDGTLYPIPGWQAPAVNASETHLMKANCILTPW